MQTVIAKACRENTHVFKSEAPNRKQRVRYHFPGDPTLQIKETVLVGWDRIEKAIPHLDAKFDQLNKQVTVLVGQTGKLKVRMEVALMQQVKGGPKLSSVALSSPLRYYRTQHDKTK